MNNCRAAIYFHRLYATGFPDLLAVAELRRQGVDVDHMANVCGPVVRVLATFPGDGSFLPDAMGEVAFVIPALGEDGEAHVDVVAWPARDPETAGTLLGVAGLLGADAICNPASFRPGPCPIWETPLRWLQAGCAGAVLLDPALARSTFRRAPAGGCFLAEGEALGDELVAFGLVPAQRLIVLVARGAVAA